MPEPQTTDERLMVALRVARWHKLDYWARELAIHKSHETFRVQTWAYSREYGFTCACLGVEAEWRIELTDLSRALPEARESVQRLFRHAQQRGNKKRRQEGSHAQRVARCLLHRHLTREQRVELRGTRAFTMKGRDGRTYQVTEGSCNNVLLQENGTEYSLCVVPKDGINTIPVYDLMLAHKIMLETDPEGFLRTAIVYDQVAKKSYKSGAFLFDGSEPVADKPPAPWRPIDIPEEDIDNPQEWAEERMNA